MDILYGWSHRTENILLLSVFTVYSGILLGFWSGVYGTALSRTEGFQDPKSMPGLVIIKD